MKHDLEDHFQGLIGEPASWWTGLPLRLWAAGGCQGPGGSCRRARLQLDPHSRKRDVDPRPRASLVADRVAHEAKLLDRAKWVEQIAIWVEMIEVIG